MVAQQLRQRTLGDGDSNPNPDPDPKPDPEPSPNPDSNGLESCVHRKCSQPPHPNHRRRPPDREEVSGRGWDLGLGLGLGLGMQEFDVHTAQGWDAGLQLAGLGFD